MKSALYRSIVVNPDPQGRFLDAYINGTPKPGTFMQIKAAVEPVGGLFQWTAYASGTNGNRSAGPLGILLPDTLQGMTVDGTYVTGALGKIYIPLPGDDLLCLVKNAAGTDTFAIGDLMMIENATGLLLATTGSPQSTPIIIGETVAATAWAADTLVYCWFN